MEIGANNKTKQPTRLRNHNSNILEAGKIPPQAMDLEETVLGGMMLEKDGLMAVIEILKPEVFYKDAHQKIYRAIQILFDAGEPVDIITVTLQLKKSGDLEQIGGPYYITQLTSRIASTANIEFHARIIYQKYLSRELIRIGSEAVKNSFEDQTDIMDQICTTEKAINDLSEPGQKNQIEDLPAAALPVLDKLEQLRKGELKFTGVPAGLVDLDRITGGWQPGNLIIIAGRTSMGKSTLALSLAVNATEYGQKVAYYSLEMSKEELILKIISKKYKIELNDLKKGQIDEKRLKEIRKEIEKTKRLMFIDDSATMDTQQLRRSAVRLKAREGINLIIVDYLQFLSAAGIKPGQNREQEIAIISRSLKNLAKELAIPVIALSQLSRAVETRGGSMRPRLSDLRESGAIENDADLVIFCYRPEYYKIDTIEHRGVNYNAAGLALLDIAKGRNIGTQEILTNFSGKFSSFEDYRDDFEPDAVPELFPEPEEKNPWSDS